RFMGFLLVTSGFGRPGSRWPCGRGTGDSPRSTSAAGGCRGRRRASSTGCTGSSGTACGACGLLSLLVVDVGSSEPLLSHVRVLLVVHVGATAAHEQGAAPGDG